MSTEATLVIRTEHADLHSRDYDLTVSPWIGLHYECESVTSQG